MLDSLVRLVVTAEQTGGRYAVIDVTTPPGGGPPTLHTHPPAESFYALEGTLTLFHADAAGAVRRTDLAPGRSLVVPGGVWHTYRNTGAAPVRFVSVSEGGLMERFFVSAGVRVDDLRDLPVIERASIPQLVATAQAAGEALGFAFGERVPDA
jgi:mannose-6-phosphate isomerase-like protein (cupin superfamily)